jgi:hypothetical protein
VIVHDDLFCFTYSKPNRRHLNCSKPGWLIVLAKYQHDLTYYKLGRNTFRKWTKDLFLEDWWLKGAPNVARFDNRTGIMLSFLTLMFNLQ